MPSVRHKKGNHTVAISGSCFCGEVKYKIEGTLKNALSCHCSMCRKAFSSQASAFAHVNPSEFSWLSGEKLLSTYESKSGVGLKFCSKCGSTLCGTNEGVVMGVTLGCACSWWRILVLLNKCFGQHLINQIRRFFSTPKHQIQL